MRGYATLAGTAKKSFMDPEPKAMPLLWLPRCRCVESFIITAVKDLEHIVVVVAAALRTRESKLSKN